MKPYPMYGDEAKYPLLKPGMYLGLYHGFKNDKERKKVDGWGKDGPLIGPLKYFHVTYASRFAYSFQFPNDAAVYDLEPDGDLPLRDGNVCFNRMQYGDFTLFNLPDTSLEWLDKILARREILPQLMGLDKDLDKRIETLLEGT